jgi:hypothetical protein
MNTLVKYLCCAGTAIGFIDIAVAETISGSIEKNLKGVMHPYSCHCFNVAEFRDVYGKRFPICFSDDQIPNCKLLSLTGYFRDHTNTAAHTNSCPHETINVFFVEAFSCNEGLKPGK